MRKLRLGLALIVLLISLTLLAWGFWPAARERHTLPVSPSEMTLPTPSSFIPGTVNDGQLAFGNQAAWLGGMGQID